MDMLLATGEQITIALTAIALHAIGVPAISLTGAQAGIVTDGVHTKARIANITPKRSATSCRKATSSLSRGSKERATRAISRPWGVADRI